MVGVRCADGTIMPGDRSSDKVRFDGTNRGPVPIWSCSSRSTGTAASRSIGSSSAALRGAIRDGRLAAGTSCRRAARSRPARASRAASSSRRTSSSSPRATSSSRPGGATRVARGRQHAGRRAAPSRSRATCAFDFRPGRPGRHRVPARRPGCDRSAASSRGAGRAASRTSADAASRSCGSPSRRYLNRVRGTAADPSRVVICTGFAQGLGLTSRALAATRRAADRRRRGSVGRRVPGDDRRRRAWRSWPRSRSTTTGSVVDRLDAADADAVVVTAAHQYPTGGVLPPERRAALVAWAERRGAHDHRGRLRRRVPLRPRADRRAPGPRGPSGSSTPARRARSSRPGLRLGWLVAPPRLVEPITAAKQAADMGSAAFDQLALADFIERGELDRHLRRMRPIYRAPPRRPARGSRRAPAGSRARRRLGRPARPRLAAAGARRGRRRIVGAAAGAGIGLSRAVTSRRVAAGPGGLVFGYGTIDGGADRRRGPAPRGRDRRVATGTRTGRRRSTDRRRVRHPPPRRAEPPIAGLRAVARHRIGPGRPLDPARAPPTGRTTTRPSSPGATRPSSSSCTGWRMPSS